MLSPTGNSGLPAPLTTNRMPCLPLNSTNQPFQQQQQLLQESSIGEGNTLNSISSGMTAGATKFASGVASKSATPAISIDLVLNSDSAQLKNYAHSKKVGNYLIGSAIGKGSFAKVNEALHSLTSERVAMKIIDKEKCQTDPYVRKHLRREGQILQQLRHPNLIQLFEVLETEHCYYLALELCKTNLMNKILEHQKLTENVTRGYMRQLIQAVDFMHKSNIMHRDLKVENILLTDQDQIKITDFGVSIQFKSPSLQVNDNSSQRFQTESSTISGAGTGSDAKSNSTDLNSRFCKTQCGSPAYAAPEVLAKKPYTFPADIWSVGVNMFAMLAGVLPFSVQPFSIKALCQKMMDRDINDLPHHLSDGAINLIMCFLDPNPDTRINLRKAMHHAWINEKPLLPMQPSPHLNRFRSADIHPAFTGYLNTRFNFQTSTIGQHLLANQPSPISATYHLLIAKVQRYCRHHKISWTRWLKTIESHHQNSKCQNDERNKENIKFSTNACDSPANLLGNTEHKTVTFTKENTILPSSNDNMTILREPFFTPSSQPIHGKRTARLLLNRDSDPPNTLMHEAFQMSAQNTAATAKDRPGTTKKKLVFVESAAPINIGPPQRQKTCLGLNNFRFNLQFPQVNSSYQQFSPGNSASAKLKNAPNANHYLSHHHHHHQHHHHPTQSNHHVNAPPSASSKVGPNTSGQSQMMQRKLQSSGSPNRVHNFANSEQFAFGSINGSNNSGNAAGNSPKCVRAPNTIFASSLANHSNANAIPLSSAASSNQKRSSTLNLLNPIHFLTNKATEKYLSSKISLNNRLVNFKNQYFMDHRRTPGSL